MAIGGELRKARLARKRSIEDVCRSTKISASILRAIENDDFAKVPGGLFTRGFLRAYARDVGLQPDETIQRYRDEFGPPVQPAAVVAERQTVTPNNTAQRLSDPEDDTTRTRRAQIVEFGVIALIVLACFSLLRQPQQSTEAAAAAKTVAAAPVAVEKPVATTGVVAATPPVLTVDIRPTGPCWIEATADGQRIVARLMSAGDRQTITFRNDVTMRVGDPAAFGFAIDGVAGRAFGRAGQPERIQITRENYRSFLTPR
jgi:cytoskeletal protein RodZ